MNGKDDEIGPRASKCMVSDRAFIECYPLFLGLSLIFCESYRNAWLDFDSSEQYVFDKVLFHGRTVYLTSITFF